MGTWTWTKSRDTQASKMKTAALFTLALVLIASNGASADCDTLDSVLSQLASVDVEEIAAQYPDIAKAVSDFVNEQDLSVNDVLNVLQKYCPDVYNKYF